MRQGCKSGRQASLLLLARLHGGCQVLQGLRCVLCTLGRKRRAAQVPLQLVCALQRSGCRLHETAECVTNMGTHMVELLMAADVYVCRML